MRVNQTSFLSLAALSLTLLTAATTMTVAQPPAGGPPGAPPPGAQGGPPPGDPMMPDLFIAIREKNVSAVKTLLDKGATLNPQNFLGITPLMWAAYIGDEQIVTLLLDRKADYKADVMIGGPLEMAEWGANPRVVKLLLDRGATFSKNRKDGMTALMTASAAGHAEILKLLIAAKGNVNAKDASGMTALMQASARGQAATARLLLDAGADVNATDAMGRTPLMYAAMNGHAENVKLLLGRKAAVNAKDKNGATALHLAAHYNGTPEVASLLVKSGADRKAADVRKRTPFEIALERGNACAAEIKPVGWGGKNGGIVPPTAEAISVRAKKAATLGLSLIDRTTKNFDTTLGCASCHHAGVGLAARGMGNSLGYTVDTDLIKNEVKNICGLDGADIKQVQQMLPHPEMYKYIPSAEMNELKPALGFMFAAIADTGAPADETLNTVATLLARSQDPDGSWGITIRREPLQSSPFTITAYALRVMNTYLPADLAKERDERKARARAWLMATPARTNEDRAFRLLALKWADAPQADVEKAAAELKKTQHADGGWAQFTDKAAAGEGYTRSDAYATGESLYALNIGGGVATTDPAYRRGVEYLLRTQDDDGSWYVNKRAIPMNFFTDTGFPHGESQFISYSATAWASMALMIAAKG